MKVEITGGFSDFADLPAAIADLGRQVEIVTPQTIASDGLQVVYKSVRLLAKILTS